ncbi:MAG: redoxin domain-containing protein, partial [Candidatus Bipolaricaulota bacterium]|nr:redoxin domain-containing protein [Candidatus Bipolaricaulota bacterium]
MIRAGMAPGFTLESPSGATVSLRDLVGLYVVLAVVPPGWSGQARDAVAELRALGDSLSPLDARAVALLPQASQALNRLASPSVTLLADPSGVVSAAYGVADEVAVFLLDRAGAVRRTWTGLGHGEEILEALREIRDADGEVNPLI